MVHPSGFSFLTRKVDKADEPPSTIYVAQMKNYPGFLKLGFCQIATRALRVSDPEMGYNLWESCMDREVTDVGTTFQEIRPGCLSSTAWN